MSDMSGAQHATAREVAGSPAWRDYCEFQFGCDKVESFGDNSCDSESGASDDVEETGTGFATEKRNYRSNDDRAAIWNEDDITESLQKLPDADTVWNLVKNNSVFQLTSHPSAAKSGILIAAWLGKDWILRSLMSRNYCLENVDSAGRTALHLSTYAGHVDCTRALLELDSSSTTTCPLALVSLFDRTGRFTALHCAASRGNLACLRLLIRHGADVNAGLSVPGNRSPLHLAVLCQSVECVRTLLDHGAIPNTPQVFSEAPLHVAAEVGNIEIVQLLLNAGASVQVQCGGRERATALHLAAEDGNIQCVRLLLDAGASMDAVNHRLQTPLHLAALSQATETIELLLERGANPNAADQDGRTPLHATIVKVSRSCDCVKLLLSAGADVNRADYFGYTPLHLAALNEFSQCVWLLIQNGGDVTSRTNGGVSVLTFITRRTPDIVPKYIRRFDNAIRLTDHEIGDVDCEVKLDFRVLVPTKHKRETELMLSFIEVGNRNVLNHPLCETFLFLKWRRIRKFFLFSLFYHSLYVLLYTIYVMGVFLRDCQSSRRVLIKRPVDSCTINMEIIITGYAIMVLNILLMLKELFQIAHGFRKYCSQWENWLQWFNIISVFLCVYPNIHDIRATLYDWQHHVAAVGIFFAWLELEMIVGRFPIFGLYVQMFTTVAVNFGKFFLAYACLLIAFGLSFGVLFANYPAFKDMRWAIMKTIIMMSGELEFEDLFYSDEYDIVYPVTAHIMYLAFVLLVTIILTNLMVGLAVSDIQGLLQSAGLDRLVRQAELVAHLESLLFSRLLRFLPTRFLTELHRQALLMKSEYHWAVYVRPNDPRESRIPKYLIDKIYKLVVARKPKYKKRSEKFRNGIRVNSNFSRPNSMGNLDNTKATEIRSDDVKLFDVNYL